MRVAMYLRVSTKPRKTPRPDKDAGREQTVENQRIKLIEFAKAMDWTVVAEYADQESGAKSDRAQFLAMMAAASRREFDCLLVWSLDRFSREGIGKTLAHLNKLADYKIAIRSFSEPFLDTTTEFGELIKAIFAFFAAFERKRIIERTKAGMYRAKSHGTRSGKAIGRPKLVVDRSKALALRRQGLSVRRIAAKLKISNGSAHALLRG